MPILKPFTVPVSPWSDTTGPNQVRGSINQIVSVLAGTTTAGVTTGATTIYTPITASGFAVVNGDDGAGNAFVDQVAWNASGAATAVSSTDVVGTPAVRAYTIASGALQLAMASGTYSIVILPTIFTT